MPNAADHDGMGYKKLTIAKAFCGSKTVIVRDDTQSGITACDDKRAGPDDTLEWKQPWVTT